MTITLNRTPRTLVPIRTNELSNPSFTVDDARWSYLGNFGTGGAGSEGRKAITWSPYGGWALQKQWTAAPSGGVSNVVGFRYTMPAPGATTRTFSVRAITSWSATVLIKAFVYSDTAATQLVASATGTAATTTPDLWARPSVTITSPAGAQLIRFDVYLGGALPPANGLFTIQQAMSETSGNLGSYFDGDTYASGNGTQRTVWTGTAGASQSQLLDYNAADVATPYLVTGYDSSRAGRSVAHQFLSGAVGATLLPAGLRSGTLRLLFIDPAAAAAAVALLSVQSAFQFTDDAVPAEGMLLVVTGPVRSYQDDTRLRRFVEVPYSEVSG